MAKPRKLFIGIDPGIQGAIATMDAEGEVIDLVDMPVVSIPTSKRTKGGKRRIRNELDEGRIMAKLGTAIQLAGGPHHVLAVIEHASPRPGESAMSGFRLGINYATPAVIASAMGIPNERPYPQTWKKVIMSDGPKDKKASVPAASRLFPAAAYRFRGPKGAALDGRADAAMLAEYGRRTRI